MTKEERINKNGEIKLIETEICKWMVNRCNRLKCILFNFWCTVNEIMIPKFVDWILDEFDECNQQAPWMWTIHDQTFQENTRYLFLEVFRNAEKKCRHNFAYIFKSICMVWILNSLTWMASELASTNKYSKVQLK